MVIVELVGLLVVGFTLEEVVSPGDFRAWEIPLLLAQIAGFALVTWVLASRLFPPLLIRLRRILGVPQLSFGLLIGGLFLVVVGADKIGLHGSLGALLLGTALSGLPTGYGRRFYPGCVAWPRGYLFPFSSPPPG